MPVFLLVGKQETDEDWLSSGLLVIRSGRDAITRCSNIFTWERVSHEHYAITSLAARKPDCSAPCIQP